VVENKSNSILTIGVGVEINDYVHIAAVEQVVIGENVLIASKVFISDHNHGSYSDDHHSSPDQPPSQRKIFSKAVIIEDNVWLGEFVSVLQGVRIGKGSIIGSMSVVTSNIPPNSIAVGVPAKVIKQYNYSKKIWEKV
jgi:acetyltransferase-like isoleucine patch superfamily enzyme